MLYTSSSPLPILRIFHFGSLPRRPPLGPSHFPLRFFTLSTPPSPSHFPLRLFTPSTSLVLPIFHSDFLPRPESGKVTFFLSFNYCPSGVKGNIVSHDIKINIHNSTLTNPLFYIYTNVNITLTLTPGHLIIYNF